MFHRTAATSLPGVPTIQPSRQPAAPSAGQTAAPPRAQPPAGLPDSNVPMMYGSAKSDNVCVVQTPWLPAAATRLNRGNTKYLNKLVGAATLGSFLFGYSVSLLNVSMGHIVWELDWCDSEHSRVILDCKRVLSYEAFINTALFAGATIGALWCDSLLSGGRRRTIISAIWGYGIAAVSSAVSSSVLSFVWARLLAGTALGMVSVAVPTYIAEMVPPSVRGYYGSLHQLMIVSGIFVAALISLPMQLIDPIPSIELPAVSTARHSVEAVASVTPRPGLFAMVWWRLLMLTALVPVALSLFCLKRYFPFETPHWLLMHGRAEEAKDVLQRTEGPEQVAEAYATLNAEVQRSKRDQETGMGLRTAWSDPQLKRAILIGLLLSIGQQVSGINCQMARSTEILKGAGLKPTGAVMATTAIFLLNVLATVPALLLIERVGRRSLLLWGVAGQTLSLFPAMIATLFAPNRAGTNAVAALGTTGFVVAFALAYGPVLWVYLFEMYPSSIKQRSSSLAVGANWLTAVLIVFASQYLSARANYTVFTLLSLASFLFIYFFIEETRGRSMGDSPYVRK